MEIFLIILGVIIVGYFLIKFIKYGGRKARIKY
jgi:hypothetical protein